MNSLTVLLDARMVSRNIHGIGRYVINLTRGLHRAGHRVTLLTHAPNASAIIGDECVAQVIPCLLPFAHPLEALELAQVGRRGQFDVHHFPSFSVPLLVPPRTVITIHDLIHLYPPARAAHKIYFGTVVKHALKNCAQVIAVSEWTKRDLIEKLRIDQNKISVARNGLEDVWFQNAESLKTLPSPLGEPYVLTLSNPKPHKNVMTLLKACNKLWEQNLNFRLALSLGGKGLSDLEALPEFQFIKAHQNKITILKNLTGDELRQYFLNAALVVSPSFYEGFDYPAAEGLALQKNVLISRGSAHDEFNGENLRFYGAADNVDALASEIKNGLERKPLMTPSHNVPTLDSMLSETLKVYEEASGSRA